MELDYLNLILWAVGAMLAIGILMGLMRRRRDQLVQKLREHVQRQQSTESPPAGKNKK